MTLTRKLKLFAALLVLSLAVQVSQANPNDFTVRGVTGTNVFKLSEAKGKFVALHFLLKTNRHRADARIYKNVVLRCFEWKDPLS